MKHLVLVGFMGSGKTTIGSIVAHQLGLPFVDIDDFVRKRAGVSISEIFVREGESAFREMETAAVDEVSAGFVAVIATGGGALLRPHNIAILRRRGILIHLDVDAQTVLVRTGDGNSRPMLVRCENPLKRIQTLMEERRATYANADAKVNSCDSTSRVAASVVAQWKRLGGDHERR